MFRRFINWLLGRQDFGPYGILQLNDATGCYEPLTHEDFAQMEFEYYEDRAVATYGPSILRYQ